MEFDKAHPWRRLVVLFAGGFANFICAIVFAIVLVMIVGYNQALGINIVHEHTASGEVNTNHAKLVDVKNIHGVGRTEDTIKKFHLLGSFNSVIGQFNETDELVLLVERENGEMEKISGFKLLEFKDADGNTFRGLGLEKSKLVFLPMDFWRAIGYGFMYCIEVSWLILTFLGMLVTGRMRFFGNVGGPTATVSMMGEMLNMGMLNLLQLVPLISVNLALFNLLPIPALDGARMVFVGIEWVRKKPIDPAIEGRIHLFGLVVLLGLVVLADLGYWFAGGRGIFLLFGRLLL
jgi:regulator of sigma E protease